MKGLQSLLALAHVGTGRHRLAPMRKDVLEDAASQLVACSAGSSGMPGLETYSTHLMILLLWSRHTRPRSDSAGCGQLRYLQCLVLRHKRRGYVEKRPL